MSVFKVPLTTIKEILTHPNADRLSIARVYDFNVIVGKDQYKVGDSVIYVPIDSILSANVENKLFSDSKIKLNKSRIKQIKIRQVYSQGLLINPVDFNIKGKLENDYAETLGITKYEPPAAVFQGSNTSNKKIKEKENPHFSKYGGLDNFKWFPDLFADGEMVSVTEKIHGSNIRFGYVPYVANNLFRKILKFFKLTPEYEWVYGSNNVQLQQRNGRKGYYGEDIYGKLLEKYDAKNKVQYGEIWYGELYGDGIQKNYTYGCTNGEHKLVVFDLKYTADNRFADSQSILASEDSNGVKFPGIAKFRGFETPPELYRGPYNKELIKELTKGDSVLEPSQKVREGVVIKSIIETNCIIGRKVLKLLSEKYLESDQSDFH